MRANGIVVTAPALDDDPGFVQGVKDLAVEQFVAQARVETFDEAVLPRAARRDVGGLRADSADPFLHRFGNKFRTIIGADVLRHAAQENRSESRSMTSIDVSRRETRMARHSWVNSSMTLSRRILRRSWVRSSRKSYDQAWLARSALSRMHDPSFSHRRPRLGCLAGTFSPSRRQIRSTRLSLTSHPARRNNSAILR